MFDVGCWMFDVRFSPWEANIQHRAPNLEPHRRAGRSHPPYSFTIVVLPTTCLSKGMINTDRPASAPNCAVTVTLIGLPRATAAMLVIAVLVVGSVNVTL